MSLPISRRSGVELCVNILETCVEPILPTPLMYKTNTSWAPLQKWIKVLTKTELLAFEENGPTFTKGGRATPIDGRSSGHYHTTEKGRRIIKAWREVSNAFKGGA